MYKIELYHTKNIAERIGVDAKDFAKIWSDAEKARPRAAVDQSDGRTSNVYRSCRSPAVGIASK